MELKSIDRKSSTVSETRPDVGCGVGSWRPKWLQKYSDPKVFLLVFSLIGVLRSAYFTYLISVLTTIEKRYAFPSKLSALILIADNISGMIVAPFVGYFGRKINGPKLIGFGMMLVAGSCCLSGFPYLFYGAPTHLFLSSKNSSLLAKYNKDKDKYQTCPAGIEICDEDTSPFQIGAFAILWIASFMNGLGNTTFWTIGLPYIDDNVKKKNSPLYLSTSTVIRLTGVSLGFFLSSFCLSMYENPFMNMNIETKDPRWVGAWWIGFFIFGFLIMLLSVPMFFFPPSMKQKNNNLEKRRKSNVGFKDAFTTFKRVVTNPILIFDTVGGGIRYLGLAGYWVTKPRYIESQFRQSASSANFLTGATSVVMKAVGILLGGFFISKYKPKPRLLVGLVTVVELTCNLLLFSSMFVGCPTVNFAHLSMNNEVVSLNASCNQGCDCTTQYYQPLCNEANGSHYFNPCYAGCDKPDTTQSPHTFQDCGCSKGETLVQGYCENTCNALPLFLTLSSLAGIISSLARTANIIIALRCVAPEDKSFAMGLVSSYMALFVFIPYPIIFGYVIDGACLVWEKTCGETGNCWLYDSDKFRYYLHGTAFTFAMIGSFFDIMTFVYANRLKNMYDDNEEDEEKPTEKEDLENKEVLLLESS